MRKLACVLLLISALCFAQESNNWKDWKFMLGDWNASDSSGVPGAASKGWFSLQPDLGGKILLRKNHAEYPASEGRPASVHDDLMVVYREAGVTKALYTDSEGHVIQYNATVRGNKLVLLSEPVSGSPQFRLTYEPAQADTLKLLFEMAPPDHPEQFRKYIEAVLTRKK